MDAPRSFAFRDGERLIRFGAGALDEAPALLAEHGFAEYALLTTARAESQGPALVSGAARVLHVPGGPVPEAAGAVRGGVEGRPLVALGGGRVIDAAKAIAGADGLTAAAVPTTLAGSAFTPFHRMPSGVETSNLVRPALVVADPRLMTSLPDADLAATAMNALAHACEATYAPGANPVAEGAALRAAALFAAALEPGEPIDRPALALAAVLGGYAIGITGFSLHHALCQTIVRTAGSAHAHTNAVMLPHTLRFMAPRAAAPLTALARALGAPGRSPAEASEAVTPLAARSGATRLGEIGVDAGAVPAIAAAALRHPALGGAGYSVAEVEELLAAAL